MSPWRSEGSLAVAPGPVVSVYGLHLVESSSAINVIHPVGVARVDKVVASPGEYVVVAAAGDDLIVAAGAFDCVVAAASVEVIVPSATVEAVVPVGSEESIVAAGAGKDLRQGFMCGEEGRR